MGTAAAPNVAVCGEVVGSSFFARAAFYSLNFL